MIVLDTDHLTELQRQSSRGDRLRAALASSSEGPVATTIVTVEEQWRGRLAIIQRRKTGIEQVPAYEALAQLFAFYAGWNVLPFDRRAAVVFDGFPSKLVQRVGPMDCKIAAICLANDAKLLTRNRSDFGQIPDLQLEDWLHD